MDSFHASYEYDLDPDDENSTAATVYRMARAGGKRVLDLGSGPAIVSSRLKRVDGRAVTCVDNDAERLAAARDRGIERTIVADLDGPAWVDELAGEQFDVIILADVLEHLVHPAATLEAIRERRLLSDDGFCVVSIPNASHEAIIAELMAGRFTYREAGLLDSTHLRFFTRDTFTRFCEERGFTITELHRTVYPIEDTEMSERAAGLPLDVRLEIAEANPEARTYQFVAQVERMGGREAEPSAPDPQVESLTRQLQEAVDALTRERERFEQERGASERSRSRVERELVEAKAEAQRDRTMLARIRRTRTWRVRTFLARNAKRVLGRGRR